MHMYRKLFRKNDNRSLRLNKISGIINIGDEKMRENYCYYCMREKSADPCPRCGQSGIPHTDTHQLRIGAMLRDRYEIGAVLGEGGFGITYVGCDTRLNLRVAIKEYYPNGYSNRNHNVSDVVTLSQAKGQEFFANGKERFLREARVLARFYDEPGVVGVRDFFEENGTAYIVMDFLDGVDLKTYLKTRGTIPADELFAMMKPVMESLSKIHEEYIIHRDISPDNIMLLKNGKLKLLDFGAAREVGGNKSLSVVLKPGYAPEEQYRSKGNQGPWTDVYALCATMYCCLVGCAPDESIQRIFNDEVKSPAELGIRITSAQNAALMKGMQVQSQDRFQSMTELIMACAAPAKSDDKTTIVTGGGDSTVFAGNSDHTSGSGETAAVTPEKRESIAQKTPRVKKEKKSKESKSVKKSAEKPMREKKAKPKKKRLVIGVAAVVVVLLIVLLSSGGGGNGDVVDSYFYDSLPTQREMTSDCASILKETGIDGQVLSMDVTNEKVSEKFNTGVFTCDVTAKTGNSSTEIYTVELHYDYYDGQGWELSSDSKVN